MNARLPRRIAPVALALTTAFAAAALLTGCTASVEGEAQTDPFAVSPSTPSSSASASATPTASPAPTADPLTTVDRIAFLPDELDMYAGATLVKSVRLRDGSDYLTPLTTTLGASRTFQRKDQCKAETVHEWGGPSGIDVASWDGHPASDPFWGVTADAGVAATPGAAGQNIELDADQVHVGENVTALTAVLPTADVWAFDVEGDHEVQAVLQRSSASTDAAAPFGSGFSSTNGRVGSISSWVAPGQTKDC